MRKPLSQRGRGGVLPCPPLEPGGWFRLSPPFGTLTRNTTRTRCLP
ncbi:hypothetical protein [Azospirillum doebereinerae]